MRENRAKVIHSTWQKDRRMCKRILWYLFITFFGIVVPYLKRLVSGENTLKTKVNLMITAYLCETFATFPQKVLIIPLREGKHVLACSPNQNTSCKYCKYCSFIWLLMILILMYNTMPIYHSVVLAPINNVSKTSNYPVLCNLILRNSLYQISSWLFVVLFLRITRTIGHWLNVKCAKSQFTNQEKEPAVLDHWSTIYAIRLAFYFV